MTRRGGAHSGTRVRRRAGGHLAIIDGLVAKTRLKTLAGGLG